jgi:hypothetical protein
MFSRRIVTNITTARGTVHCHETRIPCGDQVMICGLYPGHTALRALEGVRRVFIPQGPISA